MSWLKGWDTNTLINLLTVGTLTTGVMPTDSYLEQLRKEAEVEVIGLALETVASIVYSDGSAVDPSAPPSGMGSNMGYPSRLENGVWRLPGSTTSWTGRASGSSLGGGGSIRTCTCCQ